MDNVYEERALTSVAGMLALIVWASYIVLSLAQMPDVPYRMMINSFFGLLACVAVIANFRYWRFAVILASCVYLVVYVVQLVRMTGMMASSDAASFFNALSFYYSASWTVTRGVFIERGVLGGLMHGFLEYAMPILVVLLLVLAMMSRRARLADSYARLDVS